MKALEHIVPERVSNVGLGYNACTAYGHDSRYGDEFYFTIEYGNTLVSDGGAYGKDGWGGWSAPLSKLIFATIETQELQFPFLYEQYEYIDDSCGAGRWRGVAAFAMRRRLIGEQPGYVNITVENNEYPLQGYAGGLPGASCYTVLRAGTPQERMITESVSNEKMQPGEVLYTVKGGGGGWGPPHEREPARVLADVLDGYASVETAEKVYGVKVEVGPNGDAWILADETERLRARLIDC